MARQCQPNVVLMDVRMPRMDAIEATRRLLITVPTCRVLVLTAYDVDEHVIAALQAGASGFILKDTPRRSLIAAVRAVAESDVLLDHRLTRRLVHDHLRRQPALDAQALLKAPHRT